MSAWHNTRSVRRGTSTDGAVGLGSVFYKPLPSVLCVGANTLPHMSALDGSEPLLWLVLWVLLSSHAWFLFSICGRVV